MKFLIVDDNPEHLKPLPQTLREAGHTVVIARDLGTAWVRLQPDDSFDLIAIDLALDRFINKFAPEQNLIRAGLVSRNLGDLPMSGQALGLRLWKQRREKKQRYCYITNHDQLWLESLGPSDPEFKGESLGRLSEVILDKSSLLSKNIADKLKTAYEAWDTYQWLL